MQKAISIKNLNKYYGKTKALAGLSIGINKGEIYCLLGPNGAGKTTLIKSIAGIVKPDSGQIEILGYNIPAQRKKLRRILGYMPQIPSLYEDISVRDNIRFFSGTFNLDGLDKKIDEAVNLIGLTQKIDAKVSTLSGGYKQRCSLAATLVHRPKLLLLDEPTAGVDPVLKESFWKYFRGLAKSGTTIIISTHLMDEPLFCDRVGIIREGRIIAEDTPAQLLALGNTNIRITKGEKTIIKSTGDYTWALPDILKEMGLSPDVSNIKIESATIEEIFLKLIAGKGHD
jgi:ABC-2 type transport system ATP-binding protein